MKFLLRDALAPGKVPAAGTRASAPLFAGSLVFAPLTRGDVAEVARRMLAMLGTEGYASDGTAEELRLPQGNEATQRAFTIAGSGR